MTTRSSTANRRVVVTGLGAVGPLGNSAAEIWEGAREGRSGIGPITHYDTEDHRVTIAGEVKDFDPTDYVTKRQVKRLDQFVIFALAAAQQAIEASGLMDDEPEMDRVGAYVGTGIGGLQEIETQHTRLMNSGPRRVSPLMIPKLMTNAASGQLSIRYGFTGPTMAVSSACASGSNAIGEAFECVRRGRADVQVTGGSEAAITPLGMSGFAQMRALSSRNDEPEKASRPFDRDRDGFVMGEGAGILVLESLEHARQRDANILAEMIGYGTSSDASHITQPDTEGSGAKASMKNALEDADVPPDRIDYINAHGTGTPAGDHVEVHAVRELFGDHAGELAMSSTKSMIGHLLGASGAVEGTVTLTALRENICPPTINLDEPGEKCWGVDLVPNEAREKELDTVMNNSFGFGGHNVSLIFTEYNG